MKKKIFFVIVIIIVVGLVIGIICKNRFDEQENKEQEIKENRYQEIKNDVKDAIVWNLGASYPKCTISSEVKGNEFSHYNSSHLVNNGYIEKKDLLDVDGKSFCDVYVKLYKDDSGDKCEVSYKIFLNCEDYKEKGYINWG